MAFSKSKAAKIEAFLKSILDSQDADVVVVRNNGCEVLFMNDSAKSRLGVGPNCKKTYSQVFPVVCSKCRENAFTDAEKTAAFETKDDNGRVFSVSCQAITWLDDKLATVFFLRDIDEEKKTKESLYEMAYLDHLTGIPNRQKLKEDFDLIREDIEENALTGVLALFDLDNFKLINDTYGHNTGDILLKRLTEHLESDPAFKGHLYRLGGDEFVLLFSEEMGHFATEDELRDHYYDLLQGAFLTYSMPNIEKSCTISMGISFFPAHGTNFSELLRKADIALYKAKENGRNQAIMFEDRYDTAEKFKDLYINIKPILIQNGKTFGYELADRGEEDKEDTNALNLQEFDRTLDALGLSDIENDARYFISYTEQFFNDTVIRNLPKDKFIIQLHATNKATEKDLYKYHKLASLGYSIALSGLHTGNITPELMEIARYCKFDPRGISEYVQRQIIKQYPSKLFIATGVNTAADFNAAKSAGFKLFEGFFFKQQPPTTQKTKDIEPLKVNYLRLLKLTSTDDYVDFQEISTVISSDVALSYKLLKLLNSAAVGLRSKMSSISMAVAYLGEENLKKWIALLALRGIGDGKPLELVRLSLIRARFGEILAPYLKQKTDEKHVFLVGLLSLLHIALDKPQEELLNEMPIADDIRESLLTKHGRYSDLISFFSNYEYSNWDEITRFAEENALSSQFISDAYITAVKWYNSLADASEDAGPNQNIETEVGAP